MKIYNSLKREKEEFVPLKKGLVGMYVCGPTVYDEPHIGHARSAYVFDVIRRYFAYKGYHVTFVRNVTDIDDKIIEKAKSGSSPAGEASHRVKGQGSSLIEETKEVAKRYLDAYHKDMKLLGIEKPDMEPKATEYIPKMIKFIELLIKRGAAYASGGDVYFDIKRANGYGKLSNQSVDKMEVGARIAPGEKKRDGLDFALWKAAKEDEPSWKSPWGEGRPGWHIECSAMSSDILGGEFDIHGGGIDLIFPHHENEIAQSEGAGKKFARYWMHNGLLTIKGEKMAKSLGNFITIKGFLARHGDPDYLKLLFLGTHYRHPVDYSEERVAEAKSQKERFLILTEKIDRIVRVKGHPSIELGTGGSRVKGTNEFRKKFEEAMDDDFNTPLALAAMFDLAAFVNKSIHDRTQFSDEDKSMLAEARGLLMALSGIFGLKLSNRHSVHFTDGPAKLSISIPEVKVLIKERDDARARKDFKKSDKIRKELSDKGIMLEDTKDGTVWRRKA